MNKEQAYLLHLITASVNGTKPQKCEGINLKYLYEYSAENQFDHIIYNHFVTLGIHDEANPIMHSFHQRYGRAIVRDNAQDMALAEISERFSENGIVHIPLKGSVVKKYYPFPEIRRSGDIDILIHSQDMDKADKILIDLGYTCDKHGREVHDVYERGKTHIEIHTSLTDKEDLAYEFCQKVWDNSIQKENYLYEMGPEFLYVYLLVHLRRHLLHMGGGGIKLILDFWILNRSLDFDEQKLADFTREAKLENLRKYVEVLMCKWFEGTAATDENVLMLEQLLLNGDSYGDYATYVNMTLSRGNKGSFRAAKIKNFINLMCPPLKVMQEKYEVLKKYPILLPFSWIKRVFDAKGEHVKAIANSVNNLDKNEAKSLARFCGNIEK